MWLVSSRSVRQFFVWIAGSRVRARHAGSSGSVTLLRNRSWAGYTIRVFGGDRNERCLWSCRDEPENRGGDKTEYYACRDEMHHLSPSPCTSDYHSFTLFEAEMRHVGEFVQNKISSSDDITGRDCCSGNKLSSRRAAFSIVLLFGPRERCSNRVSTSLREK